MTAGQQKSLVKKALRNARTYYRKMDTQGERLERVLDRMIERKTIPTGSDWDPLVREFNAYKQSLPGVEKALSDAVNIAVG